MENILIAFSFQINKLKKTMDKKLKKIFRKIEAALLDFFVEMKEELAETIEFIKNFLSISMSKENAKIYAVKR